MAHLMKSEQQPSRVKDSQAVLQILQAQQCRSCHDIVTFDESWLYVNTDDERMWPAPDEASSDRERHTIQSPQFMLTVALSVTGCHVVTLLPKGRTFNARCDIDEVLSDIACWGKDSEEQAIEN
jgi:hypothetical protein